MELSLNFFSKSDSFTTVVTNRFGLENETCEVQADQEVQENLTEMDEIAVRKKYWNYKVYFGKNWPPEDNLIPIPYCADLLTPPGYSSISWTEFYRDLHRSTPSYKLIRTSIHVDKYGKRSRIEFYLYKCN